MPAITDNNGYGSGSGDRDRDIASKGGPTTGLGRADDNHDISKPYKEDLQTQLAAKHKKKKKPAKSGK